MNINDKVRVRLTSSGRNALRYQREIDGDRRYFPSLDGWYRTSLWELMSTFGPYMYVGAPTLFEDNQIYLEGD